MNKKPQQLPSRNPVFYPVHCSHFDTQEGSKEWVQDKKPPIPSYMVQTAEEESDTTGGLAGATAGMGVLGVGGKPHAAYLAFKRIFDHDKLVELDQSEDQSELKGYDTDYFATPLWSGPGENKVGPYDLIRLSGDREFGSNNIANCGLITFNSARGGTGSGGVSWIHNFINRRSRGRGRRLNLGLSLNVSVLPSLADKNSKLAFPSYAVASFYRLAKSDIHGVILVSNQPMLERNSYDFDKVNIEIREMLVPLIVSPTGKYTVASASSTTDQADLSNAISTTVKDSETGITDTIPGLCIIGFAETYMTGNTGPDDILIQIANLALEQTTCEWTPRSGTKATGYRAFLSGPPGFFESQPTKITSDLITELTKKIQERSEEAGVSSVSAVNGDVSVQAFAQAKSVRLSVLLYNVNVPEFDQLVADGLNLNNENDFDGWDKILRLSEEQVEQLENDQDTATGPPGDDDDGDEPEIVFKI